MTKCKRTCCRSIAMICALSFVLAGTAGAKQKERVHRLSDLSTSPKPATVFEVGSRLDTSVLRYKLVYSATEGGEIPAAAAKLKPLDREFGGTSFRAFGDTYDSGVEWLSDAFGLNFATTTSGCLGFDYDGFGDGCGTNIFTNEGLAVFDDEVDNLDGTFDVIVQFGSLGTTELLPTGFTDSGGSSINTLVFNVGGVSLFDFPDFGGTPTDPLDPNPTFPSAVIQDGIVAGFDVNGAVVFAFELAGPVGAPLDAAGIADYNPITMAGSTVTDVVFFWTIGPEFPGACCIDGACETRNTESDCDDAGGVWQGSGSECSTTNCDGACCINDSCSEVSGSANCAGIYLGDQVLCTNISCPPANDSCGSCNPVTSVPFNDVVDTAGAFAGQPTGSCNDAFAFEMQNDVWYCYTPSEDCVMLYEADTDYDALIAVYQDNGADCTGFTELDCVDQFFVAPESGSSQATAGVDYYFQVGSFGPVPGGGILDFTLDCTNDGACCQDDGTCAITARVACTGFFQGEGTECTTSTCPVGACCLDNGAACENIIEDACDAQDGLWFPAGDCNAVDFECPTTGACCDPETGSCADTTPTECSYACDLFAIFPAGYTGCFGDADGSGVVNASDRGFVSANIGITIADVGGQFATVLDFYDALCKFDLDGSGVINASDRGFVSANIGLCEALPDYQNGSGSNGGVPDPRFPSGNFQGLGTACSTFDCPPANDDCGGATEVFDGDNPYDTTGSTLDTNFPVPSEAAMLNDVFYEYASTCTGLLTIETCEGGAGADTTLEVYLGDDCATITASNSLGSSDDAGCGAGGFSSLVAFPTTLGDTYTIRVGGWLGGEPSGQLTITCEAFCDITIPGGATPESEICEVDGDDTVNGGCNSTPQVFGSISCGETVSGTVSNGDEVRDLDWRLFTLPSEMQVTVDWEAEFNATVFIADVTDCSNPVFFAADVSDELCAPRSFTTCLAAGTYALVISPEFERPIDCDNFNEYYMTLSCDDCPTGACCDGTSCSELSALACSEVEGSIYLGDGTDCSGNPCNVGACCASDGSCSDGLSPTDCGNAGGVFAGGGTFCSTAFCPICQAEASDCQDYNDVDINGFNSSVQTPADDGFRTADDFVPSVSETVDDVCFWGLYIPDPSTSADNFSIRFLGDAGGFPDSTNVLGTFSRATGTLSVSRKQTLDTLDLGDGTILSVYEYTGTLLPSGQPVTANTRVWMEITNDLGGDAWFWSTGLPGNQSSFSDDTPSDSYAGLTDNGEDTAFCIDLPTGELVGDVGACCVSGACSNMSGADCTAAGGTYLGLGTDCTNNECPPDECADADTVTDGPNAFDLTGSTDSGGAESSCAFPFGDDEIYQDQWFQYTATCTGTLFVDTCGPDTTDTTDTRVVVYDSCSCGALGTPLECNDDHSEAAEGDGGTVCGGAFTFESSLTAPVTSGSCYTIRIGTFGPVGSSSGATAPDELTISCVP